MNRLTPVALAAALAVLSGLAVLAGAAGPAAAQEPAAAAAAADAIPVPDSIETRGIPPIPASAVAALEPYENLRAARFADWHPERREMLVRTRFGETMQVHQVARPLGARTQLTFFADPVDEALYRPGRPDQILLRFDEDGTEDYQLFLVDRAANSTTRLTDGESRHQDPIFSRDGRRLAFTSNARNGRDFDVYLADPERPAEARRLRELEGMWWLDDWSHDGGRLLVSRFFSASRVEPHLLDLESGELTQLAGGEGEEPAAFWGGFWGPEDRSIYFASDRGGDFVHLWRLDLGSGEWTDLTSDVDWNVEAADISDDGERIAYVINEDGISRLYLLDPATGRRLPGPDLPPGTIGSLDFRPGSHEVAFTLSWARSTADVYSFDPASGTTERWTESEAGGLDPERFAVPELVRFPTFDTTADGERRTTPAFVYRPDPARHRPPHPVYVDIHGGPEGQSRPGFLGSFNYLVEQLGVALVRPNVRGSTGYGREYMGLDDGFGREGAVRDIGALLDWIATQDDLDASRVMVGGGSYGGYMSLASMVHYSDRLRAGFDYVGISDFVTFLENTEDYRRDLRRAEYGDERDPEMRAFLKRISPLTHVDRIDVPVFVAQGANDPRVPLSEAEQVAAAIEAGGDPVWYLVAKDEGHGFGKKKNADYLRAALMEFVRRHLVEAPAAGAAPAPAD